MPDRTAHEARIAARRRQHEIRRQLLAMPGERRKQAVQRLDGEHISEYLDRVGPLGLAMNLANREEIHRDYRAWQAKINDPHSAPSRRAMQLVRQVCGERFADQLQKSGRMRVRCQGYRFELVPRKTVWALDYKDDAGELCIHSMAYSNHPYDDLATHFLHIKYKLSTWLDTACVQRGAEVFDPTGARDEPSVCTGWRGSVPWRRD